MCSPPGLLCVKARQRPVRARRTGRAWAPEASCPAPPVRTTARSRLVRVPRTYSREARGRECRRCRACLFVGLVERDVDRVEREPHGEREQAIHAQVEQRVRNHRRVQTQLHGRRHLRRLVDGGGVRLRRRCTARHSERRLRVHEGPRAHGGVLHEANAEAGERQHRRRDELG